MIAGEATFTRVEIEEILAGKGFEPGTPEFHAELRTNFIPAETNGENGEPLYMEL